MNLVLCPVCDDENQDKNTFNDKSKSQKQPEKVKYYEVEENIQKNNGINNEKRLDILLDMDYIKKKIKELNELNEYDNIRYLQKYNQYNYYKKHYTNSFNKMNHIIDGICLYKL